ncbi:MAG: hypothetical protein WA584_06485 [Pyrinomonadaceae bacterium]
MRNIKGLVKLVFLILAFGISALAQNVTVNPGGGSYPTLKDAFDAINAGTHTGGVTVDIVNSTTETAPAVLNSSGAGSASYTSVTIRPTNDAVTVAGATATGRGLIELNGADNVTIDGDNAGTGGTNRNLTLQNTAANTIAFNSVIRIALATTIVTSADNVNIRNLNILGNATGRNTAATASTAGSENASYGVLATGGASTVSATTAPTAISSLTTTIGAGATATNLTIQNNNIQTVARGVAVQGAAATVFPGLLIENNLIGNAAAGAVDQVYSMGVTAQGTNNAIVRGNTVYVESFIGTAVRGLEFGSISATGTTALFENNKVLRVRNNSVSTFGAYGINLGGGNTHTVQNNFVADVRNDQTTGTGAFSTTFGAFGIRVGVGTGHKIYHNSVHLFGALPGVTNTDLTAAITIIATTLTGVDVRNNIFSNQLTGGNPTGTRNVAIQLPTAGTSAMALTLNNNGYYVSSDAQARLAQVGATFGTGEFTVANFNASATTPASNFRSYSSTLSAAGTNDNASFAVTGVPPFVSNTDLHIPNGTTTPLESGGAAVAVAQDIDAQTRNATTPDIGADEFTGIAQDVLAPAITYTTLPNTLSTANRTISATISDNVGVASGGLSPRIYYRKNGGAYFSNQCTLTGGTPQNGTYNCTINYTLVGGVAGGDVIDYFVIAQDTATPTANISSNPAPVAATDVNTVATPPAAPNTYTIAAAAFPASINVGTGETYTSLTNAGGVFAALNAGVLTGNVVVNITTNLTGETGAVALNQLPEEGANPGTYTVTFKPSGAARTITGANANGIIKINGADRVTFDGSLSGGTDRSLSVSATAATGTVFWVTSASATNGALNVTIKNCIIAGNTNTGTIGGILTGSGTVLGNDAESPNNNTSILNNQILRVQNGMYLRGAGALDQNLLVADNTIGSATAADKMSFRGMLVGNHQNFTVRNNTITGVVTAGTSTTVGIFLGIALNTGLVERNSIADVKNTNTSGFGCTGVIFASSTTASNVTVANNFIRDVAGFGFAGATSADNGYGMIVNSGGGFKIYFNSIYLTTNQTAAGSITAALLIETPVTTVGALDVRNNIFANQETIGTRYGVYNASPALATVFSTINNNDYFAQNVGFQTSARATLANWQAATGQDSLSLAVDPLFVSTADLHLQAGSPMLAQGNTATGVNNDFDNELRDNAPDIGADEIISAPRTGIIPSGTFSNGNLGGSTLGGNITFTGNLTFNGLVNGSGNTLTLGCGATISGTGPGNYFVGPVHKDFCAPGSFTFPVGDLLPLRQISQQLGGPGFTPLTANVTALGITPSSLTVSVFNNTLLGLDPTKSLDRNWLVFEAGDLTADISFTYLTGDVNGNESDYRVFRRGQATNSMTNLCPGAPCVNTGTDTAGPVTGLTEFGRFSAAENLTPVAASVDVGGRILTSDGVTGISKVKVYLTGGSLTAPVIVRTNPFGYYNFEGLQAGQTYIIFVESKRFTFSTPTIVVSPTDNIQNLDFIAEPLQ